MVFATAALLGLAATAVAIPTRRERLETRLARRGYLEDGVRQSKPLNPVGSPKPANTTSGNEYVEYSQNWSGAVYESGGPYTAVTGTIVMPTPSVPSGGSSSTTYSASAWVGIDGDTCNTAIWQTGVDFTVKGSSVSYDAWYEWYPDYAYDFSGITFSAGDSVTMTVKATSKKAGTATIVNNTKGKTVTKTVSSSSSLCETNAEWIVEDFEECSGSSCSLVPLADFGTVTFTGASATTSSGSVGPASATIIDIEQSGKVLTSVSVTSSTVKVTYQ